MNRIPDWYAADATRALGHVWRQGVDDEHMARAYRAYLAAAPTEPEPERSEPTGWPSR